MTPPLGILKITKFFFFSFRSSQVSQKVGLSFVILFDFFTFVGIPFYVGSGSISGTGKKAFWFWFH
jgi:hypothetical protein